MRHSAAIVQLERQIEQIESKPRGPGGSVSTGVSSLDTLLPGRWIASRSGGRMARPQVERQDDTAPGHFRQPASDRRVDRAHRSRPFPVCTGLDRPDCRGGKVLGHSSSGSDRSRLVHRSDSSQWSVRGGGAPGIDAHRGIGRSPIPCCDDGVTIRLQRLAEEANAIFVTVGHVPLAALRLSFRAGRVESVQEAFGPFLPSVRPIWVRVGKRGAVEVPLLCPVSPPWGPRASPGSERSGDLSVAPSRVATVFANEGPALPGDPSGTWLATALLAGSPRVAPVGPGACRVDARGWDRRGGEPALVRTLRRATLSAGFTGAWAGVANVAVVADAAAMLARHLDGRKPDVPSLSGRYRARGIFDHRSAGHRSGFPVSSAAVVFCRSVGRNARDPAGTGIPPHRGAGRSRSERAGSPIRPRRCAGAPVGLRGRRSSLPSARCGRTS